MATILVLQERPTPKAALRRSLEGQHDLIFVESESKAIELLNLQSVDLILSRVHLENGDIFSFLRSLKRDPQLRAIPVVCFCGALNKFAAQQHESLSNATKLFGASDYLALENYCKGDDFDLVEMCRAVESSLMIKPPSNLNIDPTD